MEINKNMLNFIKRNSDKFKKKNLMEDPHLQKEFFTSFKNYEFQLKNLSTYEIAPWIESNEKHLSSLQLTNNAKYHTGQILLVDLGWNIYPREFSYIHPAIVISETNSKIFIVPCSSSELRKDKRGNLYPEYEIGTMQDGFLKPSIVLLHDAKYIDKNRIISNLGCVTPQFFNKIYFKLFSQIFPSIYSSERKP